MASLASRAFSLVPEGLRWRLLGVQQSWHEPEVRVVKEALRGGGAAIDVGGWWGPWTWWMSRYADRVVVIEPVPDVAAYLERVSPDSVEVICAAASSSSSHQMLWVPDAGLGSEGRSSLSAPVDGAAPVEVETIKLDSLDLEDLRLVKIDVEGHELEVVRGATELLAQHHPVLVVELEQRFHEQPLAEVFSEIESLGYRGSFRDGRSWRPVAEFDVQRWQTSLEDQVAQAGYFSAIRFRSRYLNNFVFRPID